MLQLAPSPVYAVSTPRPQLLEQNLPSWLCLDEVAEVATEFDLTTLWSALCARRARHIRSFFTERDCHALFELAPEHEPFGSPIGAGDLHILETVLLGGTQKQAAIGRGQSASTISVRLRRSLASMGFPCMGSKSPLIVVLAAHATRARRAGGARAKSVVFSGKPCLLVSAGRPDRQIGSLSEAEAAVVRLLIEGLEHQEIARRRGTALRTIANQISTAFKKLRVSGRSQLMSRLVSEHTTSSDQRSALREVPPTHRPRPSPVLAHQ